jgi:hypothetical protein
LVDVVILEGDPNILPWEKKNSRIRILFEMCKAVRKPVFAFGFGMQFLVHFWAVGERKLQVINGDEKGTMLKDMGRFNHQSEIRKLDSNSVLLDHSTGDYYQFDKYDIEWKPRGNFGLHYSKALEVSAFKTGLDLVRKTQIFRARKKAPACAALVLQK